MAFVHARSIALRRCPKLRFSLVSLHPRIAEAFRLRFANSLAPGGAHFESIGSSQSIAYQLLTQITFFGFNECVKTFQSALTHRIGQMREDCERLGQLPLRELLRRLDLLR